MANIDRDGFEYWDSAISTEEISLIKNDIEKLEDDIPRYGVRHAEKLIPAIKDFALCKKTLDKAKSFLGEQAILSRAILFDKSDDHNWFVPWHQDRTVAVAKKFEHEDWKNWTLKWGTHHVEAPEHILKNMITFRIHLDDAFPENGCLKLIPATHHKKLTQDEITKMDKDSLAKTSIRNAGDAFIMRPLLMHSSHKSTSSEPRKVVHLEYCSAKLPDNNHWA
ncbi:MAG: phytanoyl-CoA dioxygenase family protein [Lentisphaeraceae bacterium]|nr:phytanoyl-CoA dioxygenase family protein [Lentisphaeraceae bacterium]